MGGGVGSRYDSELAALAREKYLWNFWKQPIPTKKFCGQAADVHVREFGADILSNRWTSCLRPPLNFLKRDGY